MWSYDIFFFLSYFLLTMIISRESSEDYLVKMQGGWLRFEWLFVQICRPKGKYKYSGQWKHSRFHGCGVYEVNGLTIWVSAKFL